MKVLVTGATGFVGRHVVTELLHSGATVVATSHGGPPVDSFAWHREVEYIEADLCEKQRDYRGLFGAPDALVHLAWARLPNYRDRFHFETNLPCSYEFIKQMVLGGVRDVTVTGTCFEYGMASGCLSEDRAPDPGNSYALAKDTLRRFLEELRREHDYRLKWVRLFYLYGEGQRRDSLLEQLKQAIANGEPSFNMSGGEQLRDYLPVTTAARYIARICLQSRVTGIINCCSGDPISVRRLVEETARGLGAQISLNLGHYPYSTLEPMAFWGSTERLDEALSKGTEQ